MLQNIGIDLIQICTLFINFNDLWSTIFTAKTVYHRIMKRIKIKLSSMTAQFFISQSLASQLAFVKIALIDDSDVLSMGCLQCLGEVPAVDDRITAMLHIKMKSTVVKLYYKQSYAPNFEQRWWQFEAAQLDELVRINSNSVFVVRRGSICEASENRGNWYIARILHTDQYQILVHFFCFPLLFDEFIPLYEVESRISAPGTRKRDRR
jgi:hypothetical protein